MQPDTAVIRKPPREALAQLERVVIEGDLGVLTDGERIAYYARVCESLGINPLTRPFEYIRLNNKLTLYARKDATDQLRKINGVSVERLERERDADLELAIVTAYGRDRTGRTDSAIGAVSLKGLAGEGMANALMKAETKAKRRLTLSLAGLGWLDEIETESALVTQVTVDPVTGAIEEPEPNQHAIELRDRITERTAAIRGEPNDEPERDSGSPQAWRRAANDTAETPAPARRSGDPWMNRLHAVGAERGMDHGWLHDWAVEHFRVDSLTELSPSQRATYMELVERMPVIEQAADSPPAAEPEAAEVVPAAPAASTVEEAIAKAEAKAKVPA